MTLVHIFFQRSNMCMKIDINRFSGEGSSTYVLVRLCVHWGLHLTFHVSCYRILKRIQITDLLHILYTLLQTGSCTDALNFSETNSVSDSCSIGTMMLISPLTKSAQRKNYKRKSEFLNNWLNEEDMMKLAFNQMLPRLLRMTSPKRTLKLRL